MLFPPADVRAPLEAVGGIVEAGVVVPVSERVEDGCCDEQVLGADAERDRMRGAGGGHDAHPMIR